jgi:hypothetical protein
LLGTDVGETGLHWHLVEHHRRRHVETKVLLGLVGIHIGQISASSASTAQTILQLISLHLPGLGESVNRIAYPHHDIAQLSVEGSPLPQFPEQVIDLIELVDDFLKLLFAFLVSLVPLIEGSRDLSDYFGLGVDGL